MTRPADEGEHAGGTSAAAPGPARRRGRPRSEEARAAVLAAAGALLAEGGLPLVTIEAVSARSGVGKPTIYKYWPNRLAVAIDALAARMASEVPPADLGDARSDLTEQVRRVAAFYASPAGTALTQLLGATATDPAAARQLRDRFLAGRWAQTEVMWQRAAARGQVRADITPDVAIDVLFSPIIYRLLVRHAPTGPQAAAAIADAVLGGLLAPAAAPDRTTVSDRLRKTRLPRGKDSQMHVNGRHLAVESAGTGPAVALLHGIGGTSNVYQVQADALSSAYQVIRPDFAGAGRSPGGGEISTESHAADIAAVLDALGAAPAVIVGHSMGTLVARALAARHPAKVAGLALLAPVPPPDAAGRAAILARAAALRAEGPAAIADAIVTRSLSPATRSAKPEIAAFVRELVMRQDPEGYARNNEALAAAADPGPVDPRLPLLLIAGRDDTLSPPSVSAQIARAHGSAHVRVIDGIGHQIPLEDARQTTQILTAFISACFAPASRTRPPSQ